MRDSYGRLGPVAWIALVLLVVGMVFGISRIMGGAPNAEGEVDVVQPTQGFTPTGLPSGVTPTGVLPSGALSPSGSFDPSAVDPSALLTPSMPTPGLTPVGPLPTGALPTGATPRRSGATAVPTGRPSTSRPSTPPTTAPTTAPTTTRTTTTQPPPPPPTPVVTVSPAPQPAPAFCAWDKGSCSAPYLGTVIFGRAGKYAVRTSVSSVLPCTIASFGYDPNPSATKACWFSRPVPCATEGQACAIPAGKVYVAYYSGRNGLIPRESVSGSFRCDGPSFGQTSWPQGQCYVTSGQGDS